MKYTVHLPLYLTQLSLLLRAANKLCLLLSVKDSVVSNIMVGELYISLYLEQNSPLGPINFWNWTMLTYMTTSLLIILHTGLELKLGFLTSIGSFGYARPHFAAFSKFQDSIKIKYVRKDRNVCIDIASSRSPSRYLTVFLWYTINGFWYKDTN